MYQTDPFHEQGLKPAMVFTEKLNLIENLIGQGYVVILLSTLSDVMHHLGMRQINALFTGMIGAITKFYVLDPEHAFVQISDTIQ
jgi:hypothetical protein